jgi:hypothetical protein
MLKILWQNYKIFFKYNNFATKNFHKVLINFRQLAKHKKKYTIFAGDISSKNWSNIK